MALTSEDKQKQLRELSSIVSGIRLFNRDCGKGGEGIDDCKSTCSTTVWAYQRPQQYIRMVGAVTFRYILFKQLLLVIISRCTYNISMFATFVYPCKCRIYLKN